MLELTHMHIGTHMHIIHMHVPHTHAYTHTFFLPQQHNTTLADRNKKW